MISDQRLFEVPALETSNESSGVATDPSTEPGSRVVRVLVDVSGIDKTFDYVAPQRWADSVEIGTIVSVKLHGRRVDAWVMEVDVAVGDSYTLRPIERVLSMGPPAEIVELAQWTAFRWAGRRRSVLRSASPPVRVSHWPTTHQRRPEAETSTNVVSDDFMADVVAGPQIVGVITGASQPTLEVLQPLVATGDALVVVPTVKRARYLAGQLSRSGITTHQFPRDWASGVTGGVVVGQRSSVWAPLADQAKTMVVVDEHDDGLQDERNPTWHARDVLVERARRRGARCFLLSPCLSLAARAQVDEVFEPPRDRQRSNWPVVEVIDRRKEEPGRYGLFSPQVVEALREASSGVAILNRKGRSVMLSCRTCGELVKTTDGERLMAESNGALICPSTGETRPKVCAVCGGTTLKRLRLGVSRAAEELSALIGEPVIDISKKGNESSASRISIGTEAALYQLRAADVVVFLDFDQELLAPRYRVAEQAMALLVRSARLIRGRSTNPNGRLIIQTRTPEHRVLAAAVRSDVSRLVEPELELRSGLGLPPHGSLAELSNSGASDLADSIRQLSASNPDRWPNLMVMGPREDGNFLVRSDTAEQLGSILAEAPRPQDRVRVVVDPPRA